MPSDTPAGGSLSETIQRWLKGEQPSAARLRELTAFMQRLALARTPGLSSADAQEIVSEVIEEFLDGARRGVVDPERVSLAYLLAALRWRTLDFQRRRARARLDLYGAQ